MGVVQLSDDLARVVDAQVAAGHAADAASFLSGAVLQYAAALECDAREIEAAVDEGLADIAAGRFETISGPDDMQRLMRELRARRHST